MITCAIAAIVATSVALQPHMAHTLAADHCQNAMAANTKQLRLASNVKHGVSPVNHLGRSASV